MVRTVRIVHPVRATKPVAYTYSLTGGVYTAQAYVDGQHVASGDGPSLADAERAAYSMVALFGLNLA